MTYQPEASGLRSAREAVSQYYRGRVHPDQVVLTASTSEAYSWLFKLLCDPADEVLVPRPSYPLFEFLADLEAVHAVQYPMHYGQGWYIDRDALRASITGRTRAIVFVHPNNPTGSFCKPDEFAFLQCLGLPLIFDEVFLDYGFDVRPEYPADFRLSGLSKVCGLPQLKLGWIVVNDPAARESLELITDTFLSVGSPVQHALPKLLATKQGIQEQIMRRARRNMATLRELGATILEPEGGWTGVIQVPRTRSEEEWVLTLLREHRVLVQPGYFYDFTSEAFLVLSLLTPEETFREGARRTILATTL